MKLNLDNNNIGIRGSKVLANIIITGRFNAKITLEFMYNNLGTDGARVIAKSLKNAKFISGLILNLKNNNIKSEGELVLTRSWQNYYNNLDAISIFRFTKALGKHQMLVLYQGRYFSK